MKTHPLLQEIPGHLLRYTTLQNPSLYTPIDHACWRYIIKLSRSFFEKHAHQKYLDGLRETGISTERIPLIEEMDACLRKFNWRAVSVSGFIPPATFMEFLSLGVLPIACEMRILEHIAYTPAPDIVHEAAGHAPIIADPEYADYLRSYGEISKKAIASTEDLNVYEAIRNLSEAKEDPSSTQEFIIEAQKALDQAITAVTYSSEATLLSRMGWWTFEYGLFGSLSQPKIYGAGLLSSLSESFHFLDPEIKKIPFSIDCTEISYDITRPQPQLFVTPDFQTLREALRELGDRMAFRKGGMEGLEKALQCRTITTTVLDSGIQISGILKKIHHNVKLEPIYLNFAGPTQLSFKDREIVGQGTHHHRDGFGTPLEDITEEDIRKWKVNEGKWARIPLSSGILIEGKYLGKQTIQGQLLILSFEDCTVSYEGNILFQPEWGQYDMTCGKKILSVFGGPADREKFEIPENLSTSRPATQKTNLTSANRRLCELYTSVRIIREKSSYDPHDLQKLEQIHKELEEQHPGDWLLRFELLEWLVDHNLHAEWEPTLRKGLAGIASKTPEKSELIQRGIDMLQCSR